MKIIYIGLAGALGTCARYLISELFFKTSESLLPLSILSVNILGSFFIGLLTQLVLSSGAFHPDTRTILSIGLLGGFTTYSSFNQQTLIYFQNGEMFKAAGFAASMLLSCFFAGIAGSLVAKAFSPVM